MFSLVSNTCIGTILAGIVLVIIALIIVLRRKDTFWERRIEKISPFLWITSVLSFISGFVVLIMGLAG
jgi:uncharacterized membrane protein YfcA